MKAKDIKQAVKALEQISTALTAACQVRNLISETDHGGHLGLLALEADKEIERLENSEETLKKFVQNQNQES